MTLLTPLLNGAIPYEAIEVMNFDKSFRVTRLTGPSHNLLGLEFGESPKSGVLVEPLPPVGKGPNLLIAAEIQRHVLEGINNANEQFGTNYIVKRIEFVPDDSPPAQTYELLAYSIVERLARNLPFQEGGRSHQQFT
jgi:hypothetical protein